MANMIRARNCYARISRYFLKLTTLDYCRNYTRIIYNIPKINFIKYKKKYEPFVFATKHYIYISTNPNTLNP